LVITADVARLARRRRGAAVGDGKNHRDQRDAVGDAMVHAGDERRAARLEVLEQMELPQRAARVQRPGREAADDALERVQGRLAPRGLECTGHYVRGDVEVLVVHPLRAHRVLDHLLAEAVVSQQRRLDAFAQVGHREPRLDQPDPDDQHQVGLGVHAHPGRVDPGHAFHVCAQMISAVLGPEWRLGTPLAGLRDWCLTSAPSSLTFTHTELPP
jgi:hypothetical protein